MNTETLRNAIISRISGGKDIPVIAAFSDSDQFDPKGTVSVEIEKVEIVFPGTKDYRVKASIYARTLAADDPDLERISAISGNVIESAQNITLQDLSQPGAACVGYFLKELSFGLEQECRVSSLELEIFFS